MAALLFHRLEGKYSRDQWLDEDDWWMVNVVCRPDRNAERPERGYYPVPRSGPKGVDQAISFRELFFLPERVRAMRALGMTDGEMEEAYQKWFGGYVGPELSDG